MPGLLKSEESEKNSLNILKLHPSFAAEILGLDLSTPPSEATFTQIISAVAKVYAPSLTRC